MAMLEELETPARAQIYKGVWTQFIAIVKCETMLKIENKNKQKIKIENIKTRTM